MDTAENISLSHEFVINLVHVSVAQAMKQTAASVPYGEEELQLAGLQSPSSSVVRPPRIAEAPAILECTGWGALQIGDNRLIIGMVKRLHVRDELFVPATSRIHSEAFHVVGRMAVPNWYC